jgi:hypothetical protein
VEITSVIPFDTIALAITAALQAWTANELKKTRMENQRRDDRDQARLQ